MRGAFDDEDFFDRRPSSGDAEFTLGAGTLLLLVVGLLVLCGICFGAGCMMGHRGGPSNIEAKQNPDAPAQPAMGQSKPSATSQPAPAVAQPAPADSAAPAPVRDTSQPTQSVTVQVPPSQGAPTEAGQPQVRPALPPTTATPQPVNPYPSHPAGSAAQPQVRAATPQPGVQLWVQIAAVSHIEDAQVLTRALQKRGYAVTPRRESDNLIHVRIGPFSSRDEATRWRAKLLDDGYNAEIQQ
jgi:DedD protein